MAAQIKKQVRLTPPSVQNPYYVSHESHKQKMGGLPHANIGSPEQKLQNSRRSTSKAKSQFNYTYRFHNSNNSRSGESNYTMSIRQRIQKACLTNNANDIQKQNMLLMKEIERLQKQLLKKDQCILQAKASVIPSKENKVEIAQLYRALHYYEGKIKEMEKQIYKFRELFIKSPSDGITVQSVQKLFDQLIKDNQQLGAQLEQTEYQRELLSESLSRLKTKHYQTQHMLSQYRRREYSPLSEYYQTNNIPLKSQQSNKINQLLASYLNKRGNSQMELKEKEIIKRQLENKLDESERKIQGLGLEVQALRKEIETLKVENQMLKNQVEDKNQHITNIFKDYMTARKSLKKIQAQLQSQQAIRYKNSERTNNWTPTFKNYPNSAKNLPGSMTALPTSLNNILLPTNGTSSNLL